MAIAREVTACRVCGGTDLQPYLDLGKQPLANALKVTPDQLEARVPLVIAWCPTCGLSQLTRVVDPTILYTNYPYRSGVGRAWQEMCEDLADEFAREGQFVLDIGGNDGTLLKAFDRRGCQILNVDPGITLTGVPTLLDFWSPVIAQQYQGQADRIFCTNGPGHIDDIHAFLQGVALALKSDGLAIFQAPHILPLLQHTLFDTIYHEHVSYWSVGAMLRALEPHGLFLQRVIFLPDWHGGTMRYVIAKTPDIAAADEGYLYYWVKKEWPLRLRDTYEQFASRVQTLRERLGEELSGVRYGVGAAAKTTVLLNAVKNDIVQVYDDAPTKEGKYIPGTRIPIAAPTSIGCRGIARLVLFAWNFAPQLVEKYRGLGFRGRFLVPLPEPHWIE